VGEIAVTPLAAPIRNACLFQPADELPYLWRHGIMILKNQL
jgi:hypothetical protein